MKKIFLLIVLTALLVALGFAQTPATSINLDQTNLKGCLGGTDGNYTVTENNTGRNFKITTSTVNLTPHVGHEVALTGTSSAAVANSFAVTELSMISEHCAGTAAIPAAIVGAPSAAANTPAPPTTPTSLPLDVAAIPAVAAAAPGTTSSAVKEIPVIPVAATTAAAATVSAPTETVDIPSVAATPDTTVTAPPETVSKNATGDKQLKGSPAQNRTQSKKPEAAAVPAAATTTTEPASTPAAAEVAPDATVSAPAEPASTLTPNSTKPIKSAFGGSLWLLVSFVVLVLLIGGLAPLISRWRKQKVLEKMGPQNLSFSNEVTPTESKTDEPIERKIA